MYSLKVKLCMNLQIEQIQANIIECKLSRTCLTLIFFIVVQTNKKNVVRSSLIFVCPLTSVKTRIKLLRVLILFFYKNSTISHGKIRIRKATACCPHLTQLHYYYHVNVNRSLPLQIKMIKL